MAALVQLPGYLRDHAGGSSRVELGGATPTVEAALAALFALHPGLRARVMTEAGQIRPHVNVFVDRESIRYTGGLATPVPEGALISILPAVSGGAV